MEAAIVVCAAIAVKAAYIDAYLGLEQPTLAYLVLGLLLGAILHLFYTQLGLYEPRAARDSSVRIGKLWGGLLMSFLVLLGILYLLKIAEWFSRGWMLLWFASSAVLLGVMRTALLRYTRALVAGGRLRDRVAIYGSLDLGRQLQSYIGSHCPDIEVVSLYVDDRESGMIAGGRPDDVDGGLEKLIATAREGLFSQIFIALPSTQRSRIRAAVKRLALLPLELHLCTDMTPCPVPVYGARKFGDLRVDLVMARPDSERAHLVKAAFDYTVAAVLLLLFSPLFAAIAIAIKKSSPGPVFFRQRRYGCNHRVFSVFKFRTMSVMEDGEAIKQAEKNDPRVTAVGRFLRRTSLDELPQLINVLRGEMSIVGPRPHAVAHDEHFARQLELYPWRHRVKPGITGWAQIHGLRGETRTPEDMQKRIEHDFYYIENWSIWLDVEILIRTAVALGRGSGAY